MADPLWFKDALIYELHVTNFAPWGIELSGLEVFGEGTVPLAAYRGEALTSFAFLAGIPSQADPHPF